MVQDAVKRQQLSIQQLLKFSYKAPLILGASSVATDTMWLVFISLAFAESGISLTFFEVQEYDCFIFSVRERLSTPYNLRRLFFLFLPLLAYLRQGSESQD